MQHLTFVFTFIFTFSLLLILLLILVLILVRIIVFVFSICPCLIFIFVLSYLIYLILCPATLYSLHCFSYLKIFGFILKYYTIVYHISLYDIMSYSKNFHMTYYILFFWEKSVMAQVRPSPQLPTVYLSDALVYVLRL